MEFILHLCHIEGHLETITSGKSSEYDNIMTGKYVELRKEVNIDLIVIYNIAHARDIVAVNKSMFPETIMSIHEDDFKSGFPREYEWSDLYVTERTNDDIINSLGV